MSQSLLKAECYSHFSSDSKKWKYDVLDFLDNFQFASYHPIILPGTDSPLPLPFKCETQKTAILPQPLKKATYNIPSQRICPGAFCMQFREEKLGQG
jgi:hypothetical protein